VWREPARRLISASLWSTSAGQEVATSHLRAELSELPNVLLTWKSSEHFAIQWLRLIHRARARYKQLLPYNSLQLVRPNRGWVLQKMGVGFENQPPFQGWFEFRTHPVLGGGFWFKPTPKSGVG